MPRELLSAAPRPASGRTAWAGLWCGGLLFLTVAEPRAATPDDTAVYAQRAEITSLDPAGPYDADSQAAIYNLYETLIAFKGSSLAEFEPRLAVEVPTLKNGGVSKDGLIYRFKLRKGARFHGGAEMTPEDVRYSILRFMLTDRAGGPSSLLLEPILGVSSTRSKDGALQTTFEEAAEAVSVEGPSAGSGQAELVLRLKRPFAPFLSIMARWSYVVCKKTVASRGGWDGGAESWKRFNDPKLEDMALFDAADGTGAFRLERWDRQGRVAVMLRHDGYWRKPAALKRVVWRSVPEFATRRLLLQGGDADVAEVQRPFADQLVGLEGIRLLDDLPRLMTDPVIFFTLDVSTAANPDIGSGRLDGQGVPPDFFRDPDVRKGFACAFDYRAFLKETLKGKASRSSGPVPPGLLPKPPAPSFEFDPARAAAHFKKALGGRLWDTGFTLTLSYNTGSELRESACQILRKGVEALNPKFRVNVRPVDWPVFLDRTLKRMMPIWSRGWIADYPDAHNFAFPFLHSQGRYAISQGLKDPELDGLVESAVAEPDPSKRAALYRKLQKLGSERAYHVFTVHPSAITALSDRIQGYVDNPVFMGPWFYPVWKK